MRRERKKRRKEGKRIKEKQKRSGKIRVLARAKGEAKTNILTRHPRPQEEANKHTRRGDERHFSQALPRAEGRVKPGTE